MMIARIGAEWRDEAQAAADARQQRLRARPAAPAAARGQLRTTKIMPTKQHGAREKRAARADPRRERARERRADGARHVHRHRAQRDRLRHVGALDQLVDARLLRRHVEREADADHEREREQRPRRHHAEQRRDAEHDRAGEEHDLRREDDVPPLDDVGERARDESEQRSRAPCSPSAPAPPSAPTASSSPSATRPSSPASCSRARRRSTRCRTCETARAAAATTRRIPTGRRLSVRTRAKCSAPRPRGDQGPDSARAAPQLR